ncbi:MAG: chemotaxis protein CheZ, partial [Comamonadaceae bacterium]|nr:chemotaxis protein CheZ [Comamonadaceae bacterium]
GQVIKKVVTLAAAIEEQLLQLLLESAAHAQSEAAPQPAALAASAPGGVRREQLAGPVVDLEGRSDVVTDQSQVDDLLASLGF